MTGQLLVLAKGLLPEGKYSGFSVGVKEAYLLGEEGEGKLLFPDKPLFVAQPFQLTPETARAFYLNLDLAASLAEGYHFFPVIHASEGSEQLVALKGYVTETPDSLISIFDKVSLDSVGIIGTGAEPMGIVLDSDQRRAYVAASGDDAIEVFDLSTRRKLWRIPLQYGDRPVEAVLTPDGRTLVVADSGSGTVSLVDTGALAERTRIRVGDGPSFVVVDGRGERAYVLNRLSHSMSVLDLASGSLVGNIRLENVPRQAALSPSGDKLYLTGSAPSLTVLDVAKLQIVDSLQLGANGTAVKIDPRSGLIYMGLAGEAKIVIVDPFTLGELDSIPVAGPVGYLALDPEDSALFALVPGKGLVQKVDVVGQRVIDQMPVASGSHAVAVIRGK